MEAAVPGGVSGTTIGIGGAPGGGESPTLAYACPYPPPHSLPATPTYAGD